MDISISSVISPSAPGNSIVKRRKVPIHAKDRSKLIPNRRSGRLTRGGLVIVGNVVLGSYTGPDPGQNIHEPFFTKTGKLCGHLNWNTRKPSSTWSCRRTLYFARQLRTGTVSKRVCKHNSQILTARQNYLWLSYQMEILSQIYDRIPSPHSSVQFSVDEHDALSRVESTRRGDDDTVGFKYRVSKPHDLSNKSRGLKEALLGLGGVEKQLMNSFRMMKDTNHTRGILVI